MTGVTIGITPVYRAIAELSCICLKQMTGLDSIILDETHLASHDLSHPASLKFKIFEIVKSADVLYFDADWFCLRKWDPAQFKDNPAIVACNDFVLKADWPDQYEHFQASNFDRYPINSSANCFASDLRDDYVNDIKLFTGIKRNALDWINTGFWIANKKNHKKWLTHSFELYKHGIGHHKEYYEQPAMNKSIEDLNIQVTYLNRKFNTLIIKRKQWPSDLVGYHVKLKHHSQFIDNVLSLNINSAKQVKEYLLDTSNCK